MSADPIKLVVAIPTAGRNHIATTASLLGMFSRLTAGIPTRPDTALEFGFDFVASSDLISNREQLVKRALDTGRTHLMFVDDDMGFEPQVLEILLGRRQPAVGCNYLIKRQAWEAPTFVAVALNGRRIVTRAESTGLQEIAYTGFGVSLFETGVFRRTPPPWFLPKFVPEESRYTTEDNPCFERIRAAGIPCYVDHDASKLVTHHGDGVWRWDQWRPVEVKPELKVV